MTQPAASIQDTTLGTLFRYKAWADAELMTLLCQPVEALDDAGRALHLQAVRLMNHIHVVDRIFIAHLTGQSHPYTATNTPETPTPEQLSWDMADTAAWLLEHTASIAAEALGKQVTFTFTNGDPGCMTRLEMLLHLHAHGTHHRGQVSQMLKTAGLVPPRELLTRMLHVQEPGHRQQTS